MKRLLLAYIILLQLFTYQQLSAVVYNFRIAQITRQAISTKRHEHPYTASILTFDLFQKRHEGIRQNFSGAMGSFIYDFGSSYYVRADTAFTHINETKNYCPHYSGTEFDDILFSAGRSFIINNRSKISLSALLGIPTHQSFVLQHATYSIGQFGTGLQIDGSYKFDNKKTEFVYGARYVYFIPTQATDNVCNRFKFTIGSQIDLLTGVSHNWKQHGIEAGYSSRWNFGAKICPLVQDVLQQAHVHLNTFYLVYKYTPNTPRIRQRILFNMAYSFDDNPGTLGLKLAIMTWIAWGMNF